MSSEQSNLEQAYRDLRAEYTDVVSKLRTELLSILKHQEEQQNQLIEEEKQRRFSAKQSILHSLVSSVLCQSFESTASEAWDIAEAIYAEGLCRGYYPKEAA